MFDIFGIKAKIKARKKLEEEKRLAQVNEERERYRKRKQMIDEFITEYNKEESSKAYKEYVKKKERADAINSTCPLCHSKNVVHNIVRGKGEIHGKGSSSIIGSFGGTFAGVYGSLYGSGNSKIDGNFDTYPVNKCSSCGHEWNIEEVKYKSPEDIFSHYSSSLPGLLYYKISEYLELSFDEYDIKEKFNSLEEKKEDFCKIVSENIIYKSYKTLPRYMLDCVLFNGLESHEYYIDSDEKHYFNYKDSDDKYSYQMPDEVWEILKKIIKWEGPEE